LPVASVRLNAVEKTYRRGDAATRALRDVTLEVGDGATIAVLGPSGCGKTTLLRVIAGLERPERGQVFIDARDVTAEPPERRSIGFVFQRYALYPHLSVLANVAYGPRARGLAKTETKRRVRGALQAMRVDETLWRRKPASLSGGQQQRVALARALAIEPGVLLLDEPLTGLDAGLRADVRVELALLQRARGATMFFVTHDQSEALSLGQCVAVMRDGALEQLSSPRELYERPANAFVATFVGTPAMALVDGAVVEGRFRARGDDFSCPAPGIAPGTVTAGFRAEAVRVRSDGEVRGVVRAVEDLGSEAFVYVDGTFGALVARCEARALPLPGERIELALDAARVHYFGPGGARLDAIATGA
jgi:ABC-type sugar transport system ATPase subunit